MIQLSVRLFLASSLFLFLPSTLFSFPEFIRKGYPSCISCHISPSGGGSLTKYGRMVSAEMFSTWGESGESWLNKRLIWGGDVRYLYLKDENREINFLMQADLELGIEPIDNLYLIGSGGIYGRDRTSEISKAYAMYKLTDDDNALIARYGKFFPNYGLMIPDHTRNIRLLHNVSRTKLPINAELTLVTKWGELSYTNMLGLTDPNRSEGLSFDIESNFGEAARAALYLTKYAQIGYSYMDAENRFSHGPFFAGGYKIFYLLGQIEYQDELEARFLESGLEIFKGCNIFGIYENNDNYHYGFKWYPYRHFEILTEYYKDNKIVSMVHYYF